MNWRAIPRPITPTQLTLFTSASTSSPKISPFLSSIMPPCGDAQMRLSIPISLVSVVTLCLASHRDVDFPQLSGLRLSDGGSNLFGPRPGVRPSPGEQRDDGQTSACEVLLVPHVPVGGYQQIVALTLRNIQQVSVAQL